MSTSRRTFLKTAAVSAPTILGASKSGSKNPVIGSGEHQYEVTHDWGELPAQIKYGNTHGVMEDSQGLIYVHHTVHGASESADSMVVFDPKGRFVRSFGKEFKTGAHGLHIRKEGSEEFLYLCDTSRSVVVKTNLKGDVVWSVGYPEESEAYKPNAAGKKIPYRPTNLAIAPNGDIYVGDGYGSSFVNVYDKSGKFKFTFGGGKAKEAGKLNSPHGIMIDTRGKAPLVMVADRSNNRIQYFTLDGKHHSFAGGVNLPCHFHERKGLVVVPDLAARITLLDRQNQVIAHLGEGPDDYRDRRKKTRGDFLSGKFVCPHGACFDHKGNIFVVEWVEIGRVTKLRKV